MTILILLVLVIAFIFSTNFRIFILCTAGAVLALNADSRDRYAEQASKERKVVLVQAALEIHCEQSNPGSTDWPSEWQERKDAAWKEVAPKVTEALNLYELAKSASASAASQGFMEEASDLAEQAQVLEDLAKEMFNTFEQKWEKLLEDGPTLLSYEDLQVTECKEQIEVTKDVLDDCQVKWDHNSTKAVSCEDIGLIKFS